MINHFEVTKNVEVPKKNFPPQNNEKLEGRYQIFIGTVVIILTCEKMVFNMKDLEMDFFRRKDRFDDEIFIKSSLKLRMKNHVNWN